MKAFIEPWMKITPTLQELHQALYREEEFENIVIQSEIRCSVREYLIKNHITALPSEINLVKVRLSNFVDQPANSLSEVYLNAKDNGLYLCPLYIAPLLRKLFYKQARSEKLFIAINPIVYKGQTSIVCLYKGLYDLRLYCKLTPVWFKEPWPPGEIFVWATALY